MYYDITESGKRIKELRESKNLTQGQVSEKLGISLDGYKKIERGRNGAKIDTLVYLAAYFNTSLDYLVCGVEPKSEVDVLIGKKTKGERQFILAMLKDLMKNMDLVRE